MSDATPLEGLAAALQAYAVDAEDAAVLVTAAVVVLEVVRMDDDGHPIRRILYTIPDDSTTMAAALGLLEAGQHYVRRDLFSEDPE